MRQIIKWIALLLASMLGLMVIAGAVLAMTFDPNDYKPQLIRLVQEKTQRSLSIPGRIQLSWYPRLGADLGRVTLSERQSSEQFAAVDSVSVALQLLPLLRKEVIVDRIEIDGLHARIRREKNGSNNIADLFSDKNDSASQPVQLDIDHVRIRNAELLYEDRATQRRITISIVNFSSGRLVTGVKSALQLSAQIKSNQPAATLAVQIGGDVLPDFEKQVFAFDPVQIQLQGKLGEQPVNTTLMSALQVNLADKRVDGKLTAGATRIAGLRLASLQTTLHADAGKVVLKPLAAQLYGGSLHGAVSVNMGKPVSISVNNTLQAIQIAPLLKDLMGREPVEGRGDVKLDLRTEGDALPQLKQKLNGTISVQLQDGALRGVNIARTVREAKGKLQALQRGDLAQVTGNANTSTEKTDFSTLKATLNIINGVAHNDDLEGSASAVTIRGAGQADLVTEKLDYVIQASVPELQGYTVPVRLSGSFTAVNWKLDTGSLGKQLLKQKQEVLQEKLKDQLKGLFGQ